MTAVEPRILRRLERCVRRWPRRSGAAFVRYVAPGGQAPDGGRAARPDPVWLAMPEWLASHHSDRGLSRAFVRDVQWGQYCLFLFVRIHDDLFDRHARELALIYAGDLLLVESQRAFARHLSEPEFWAFYRHNLEATLHGVLAVNGLERRSQGLGPGQARVHARVGSLFKVGAAAVCFRTGRHRDLKALGQYADHLAIAGQLLDDLQDLAEDLKDGRVSATANLLLDKPNAPRTQPPSVAEVGQSFMRDGADPLLRCVRRHLDAAVAAIEPLQLRQAVSHVNRVRHTVDLLSAALHRRRVEALFGRRR